jgi:outer membrane cobalamin receptor
MKSLILIILIGCSFLTLNAQYTIEGSCYDLQNEALPAVTIVVDDSIAFSSDINGYFKIKLSSGEHKLEFSFVGMTSVIRHFNGTEDSSSEKIKIIFKETNFEMDEIKITANRFEQKPEELTISVEVLRPEQLIKSGVVNMEAAADQTPGVYVADGQANIRGGSGFSYGAGSRVLVLIDDLPIVSADAGDVKWDALPLENLEQIEVLKGATSALYGSSALNGVINIKTGFAGDKPATKIRSYYGAYGNPINTQAIWWDKTRSFHGVNFTHSRRIKKHEIVIGGNYHDDMGFRLGETNKRYRGNFKTKFNTKKEGLYWGLNGNFMNTEGGQIIIWGDADSAMYKAMNGEVTNYENSRINLDPYITYFDDKGNSHKIRSRYYRTKNLNSNNQGSLGQLYFNEYVYQKKINKHNLSIGGVCSLSDVKSEIYSDHQLLNNAAYGQADFDFNRLKLSSGIRMEGFKMDQTDMEYKSNFRAGANYKVFKPTFLRASFGQGFRVPTIGEKFINTSIPGLFFIPNDSLKPEYGWSAEVGLKQLLKIGKWKGYFDAAVFVNEYTDMIEFAFDSTNIDFSTGTVELGFKAYNVEKSRISGLDFSLMGMGSFGPIKTNVLMGYTYMNPINLNINQNDSSFVSGDEILKYRFNHLAKINLLFEFKKIHLGVNYRFNSEVKNIDEIFTAKVLGQEVIPGVNDFRQRNSNGDQVIDVNIGYEFKSVEASLIVKNILNEEYATRPADPQAPRTIMGQLNFTF